MTTLTGPKAATPLSDKATPLLEPSTGQHLRTLRSRWHRDQHPIPSISLISPYKPITCGIADYAEFLTSQAPHHRWDVLSFDLDGYGMPLTKDQPSATNRVWYGIPGRDAYSAASILQGLRPRASHVLWFQHEFGIWRDDARFVDMLSRLEMPKVVTLHTLHFQSNETRYGLRRQEYSFLRSLLPHADAITVFSDGVYEAVRLAFPEYSDSVHLIRHGTHLYPTFSGMSRLEAKSRIHDYLTGESGLDGPGGDNLRRQRVLLDPETIIIGGTGFITASKGTELLYYAQRMLQQMLPKHNIAAVYVGHVRETGSSIDAWAAADMTAKYNGPGQSFLETYLPRDMLSALLRALDIYFYWPGDCTQSGIIAHALGAGATIACRDLEGVGETVKMAGGLTSADFEELILKMRQAIVDPELRMGIAESALRYAEEFSWNNQMLRHLELAEALCPSGARRSTDVMWADASPEEISTLLHVGSTL